MRRLSGLAAAAVLLLGGVSCDTTQPADAGPQTFSFEVQANGAVRIYNIYDVWVDTTGDGVPDTDTGQHQCNEFSISNVTYPWNYSASLSVIRKGSTEEEVIASTTSGGPAFTNLTNYTTGFFFGNPAPLPPQPPVYFRGGRRDAAGGMDYLTSCTSFPTPLPSPNVLGSFPTFDVVLNQGDTAVIRLRKQLVMNANPILVSGVSGEVRMAVFGSVEGRSVSLQGDPNTSGDGGGTTLSFTLR